MALAALAFKGAQLALTAEMVGLDLDYTSIAKWGYRIIRTASRLQSRAGAVDERMLAEMVDLARSRAPQRSGRLHAGITGTRDGDVMEFRAEAQRNESAADYAPFVERGTRPGARGRQVATATFYERGNGIRRRARRTHPGTEAQPFFYNSAREILERRNIEQGEAIVRAAASDQE